jgi:GntR family transcriptional regulator
VDIDRESGVPVWRQLADGLRAEIASGELAPGQVFPGEERLAQEHGVSRTTVRRVVLTLRAEGLIVVDPPRPTRVRERPEETVVDVKAGTVRARMPTPAERREHGIGEGVPVLVVEGKGGTRVYPADRTALHIRPA